MSYLVPAAPEVDHLLGPQGPKQGDLLLAPPPPIVEVLVQCLIFDVVPTHAYPQPEPSASKHVYLCRLLGYQSGLPLPQNEHGGH